MTSAAEAAHPPSPVVGDRYEVHELLGRGGMACVYRASDRTLDRDVAMKQLTVDPTAPEYASVAALFEREFHTLMQLRHPHVIAAYDYGVGHDGRPFYTMELLDGGDLRERAPIGWRQASQWIFDVCSALALLHSRRLLHRDVSPRNIRCTQRGDSKLIDFGAMAPMSAGGADVVGTPAFTAPETLQRLALDARTDLYSLGVTMYYALTNRLPYAARSFADLLAAWTIKPAPPSAFVPDIPPALDDLVLALISVEPSLRPRNAFDAMQQLAACAGLKTTESDAVSRAYLSTPTLVGREQALERLRAHLRDSRLRGTSGAIIEGPPGCGRSRLLDTCALEAQTQGFTVLRATATGTRESFATARRLAQHLFDAVPASRTLLEVPAVIAGEAANDNEARPALRNLAELPPAEVQRALRRWLLQVSRTQPLLIAIDDVHRIDQPSAALLAELIDKARHGGISVVLTADDEERSDALQALSRRCAALPLEPLSAAEIRELLASLFGEVAHLGMLADEVYRLTRGNPRQSVDVAEHLVERGAVRYASGSWTLPSRLSAEDLPRSAADAMQARIGRLSPRARLIGEAQALAYYETFTDRDYRTMLPEVPAAELELALSELLAAQALLVDSGVYTLANRVWTAAFIAGLDAEQTRERHRVLAGLYATKLSLAFIHHAFAAGQDELGLSALDHRNEIPRGDADYTKLIEQNVSKLVWCYPRAIETARRLGRPAKDVVDLQRWQYLASLVVDAPPDRASAEVWLARIASDSGLTAYRRDTESATPIERLTRALQSAQERYLATPEAERVYSVQDALHRLGEYVVISIGVGARGLDTALVRSLPELLEPFVALSPLLDAIWHNASASRLAHCECAFESARERWRLALEKLEALASDDPVTSGLRRAIAFALGMMEAQLGLPSAASWAERLDGDPLHRVNALDLRKIVRLEQADAERAERLRREAEVLALQMRAPQLFHSLLTLELAAYVKLRDLARVADVVERLKPLAERYPGWRCVATVGEASFELVRGDYEAAKAKFEQAIDVTRPDEHGCSDNLAMWLTACAGLAECLLSLGRDEEARAAAASAVRDCEARNIGAASFDVVRMLALAEGKLGDPEAAERLDAVIAKQTETGATGLRLGLSYEARARVAIWSKDSAAFEHFAELTAREYRHGVRTPLAARYERLMNDAARSGMQTQISLRSFADLASAESASLGRDEMLTIVTRSMASHRSSDERTQLALQMICSAHGASAGYLYLIGPAGLVLRASHGAESPPAALVDQLTGYLDDKLQRADDMDDMVTGDLPDDDALTSLVQVESGSYELLPLATVVDAASVLAGLAVVAVSETRVRNAKQTHLLHALAANLLQVGDSQGLRLS